VILLFKLLLIFLTLRFYTTNILLFYLKELRKKILTLKKEKKNQLSFMPIFFFPGVRIKQISRSEKILIPSPPPSLSPQIQVVLAL
jgi:hypothetical protein